MRRSHWLLVMAALVPAAIGCSAPPPPPEAPPPVVYTTTATIKDLMAAIVGPSADVVWNAGSTTVDDKGINDSTPHSDEDWATARRGAVSLVEASNLLLMPGRHVARQGEKSQTPGVELEPAQMEALITQDRAKWDTHAKALRDVSLSVLHVIDAHDADKLLTVGGEIDTACENCHKQYWYPNEKVPES